MRIPILDKLMEGPERRALDRASKLLSQGKTDVAIKTLRSGLAKVPGNPELQLELGRALGLANRGREATSTLRSLLRTTPDAVDSVRELAEMGHYENREVGHLHDVLAEHYIRQDRLSDAQSQLEQIDHAELARFAAAQKKRLDAGLSGGDAKVPRTSLMAGTYVAMAQEAAGQDAAALETYARMLGAAPDHYSRLQARLQALCSRNYREVKLRMQVLDLYFGCGDTVAAADESALLLEAVPNVAGQLAERLVLQLDTDPDGAEIRFALSRARWVEGRHDEAVELLDPLSLAGDHDEELAKLLKVWRVDRPDAARVSLMLAEILGRHGKGAQAIQAVAEAGKQLPAEQVEPALERLIAANPDEPRTYRLLAELRRGQGDIDGAVEALSSLARNAPGNLGEAAGVLRGVLEDDSEQLVAHRLLAEVMLEREDVDTAVTLLRHLMWLEPAMAEELRVPLETLAAANPANAAVRLAAAEAWLEAGDAARVLPHLQAAAADTTLAAPVVQRLSVLVQAAPEAAPEVAALCDSLRGNLTDPAVIPFLLAECSFASGDPERAAELLGDCYGRGGDRAGAAVLELLDTIVEEHPESSSSRVMMASLLVDRGEALRAVSIVADAPAPDPGMVSLLLERLENVLVGSNRDIATRTGLARLLLLAGRVEEAAVAADEAILEAGPDAPGALHMVRGEAKLELGETAEAVRSMSRAADLDEGLIDRARATMEAAHQAAPDNATVLRALARMRSRAADTDGGLSLLIELAGSDSSAALEDALALVQEMPDDPRPQLAMARMHAVAGEPAKIAASLQEAREHGATDEDVLRLLEALPERCSDEPELLFLQASCCEASDAAAACALLERAAEWSETTAELAVQRLTALSNANRELPAPDLAVARLCLSRGNAAGAFAALEHWLEAEAPPEETFDLLRRVRAQLPGSPGPAVALSRRLLAEGDDEKARRELIAARDAGASPAVLSPLLDQLIGRADDAEARLLRAGLRTELGDLDDAVEDLRMAAGQGRAGDACAAAALLLERQPDHGGARRLHIDLLRGEGREDDARASADAAIEAGGDAGQRCDLLLERAEIRREADDEAGAAADLREAKDLAEDPDGFLDMLHRRRARRQELNLADAPAPERVRVLLDRGRLVEAETVLQGSEVQSDEHRNLRAALLLARGEAAAGLRLMRTAAPAALMVDAAQRCDRPELALALVDRMLERGEEPRLRAARERLARDVWRIGLDPGRRTLVGRTSFVPRDEK